LPIYEYRCSDCGYQKEVLRKMSDAPLTTCPECGKQTFSKQLSAPSFQLSGSGWYATDFKSGAKTPAENKTEESKPAESKEEVKASAPCGTGCACH